MSNLAEQQVPEGYQQTEVGVIPEEWSAIELGEFCGFTQGVQIPQSEQLRNIKNGFIRYLYIRDFFTDDFHWYIEDVHPNKIMHKTDIMMVNTGNTAGTVYSGAYGVLSNNAFKISFDKNVINRDYFFSLLRSYIVQDKIKELSNSSGQPHVGHKNVAQVIIPVPSTIQEQTAIANALSDVDALITSIEKLIAKKRAIKTAAMQQLLTGKKRLPPFDQAHTGYKQTELGEIPEDWEVKTLGNVTEFINGRAYGLHEWEAHGIPVIRLQNLTKRGGTFYYSNLPLPEKLYCNNGDLLFMWSATFGPVIWWGEKAIYHYHIWKVECKNKTDKSFLFYTLDDMTEKLKRGSSSGGTMLHVTKEKMESTKIIFPSKDEQLAIGKVLSDMDEQIVAIKQRLNKTQQLKQGMMQELLTGKTRLITKE